MTNNTERLTTQLTAPGGLASLLRAARGDLLAKDLAHRTGWLITKISKIEHGKQLPSKQDLELWAQHTGATEDDLQYWESLLIEVGEIRQDYAIQTRAGNRALQRRFNDILAAAQHHQIFEQSFIPRFLQLADYTRAVLRESHTRHGGVDDVEAAVAERQHGLTLLDDATKKIEMVITEPVLGWRPAALSIDVHRAQLVHLLEQIDARPHVLIGIVPLFQPITWFPQNSFQLFDNLGVVEAWLGESYYVVAHEMARMNRVMAEMLAAARQGDQARAIIRNAIGRLDATDN